MSLPPPPLACGIGITGIRAQDSMLLSFKITSAQQKSCIDSRSLADFDQDSANLFIRELTQRERSTLNRFRYSEAPGFINNCYVECAKHGYSKDACEEYCGDLRVD